MEEGYTSHAVRERLIIAGIRELEAHGLNDFSLRRVAVACEVSCAAPYRHFKDKEELILEI
ncbi:MAG: helix-turn-helix transcriptional regulator, partial [Clostridia bacterium]|nr:helix-turn-helix transcriptional regulator [Clostridia bacterium]